MGTDRLERERVEGWDGVCEIKDRDKIEQGRHVG